MVVVPMVFNPAPFLASLGSNLQAEVAVQRLQLFLVPQAQAVTYQPGRGRVLDPLPAIPIGAYELVVLQRSGQYWRLPNDLGTSSHPSQALRFRFVHATSSDAGR